MLTIRHIIITTLLSTTLGWAYAAGDITLTLKKEAMITGRTYTLSEVARIEAPEADDRPIQNVSLGASPRVGQIGLLTRQAILERLEQVYPGIHTSIRWRGATLVRLHALGRVYAADSIRQAAESTLRQWLQNAYAQFTLHPVGTMRDLKLPHGGVALQAKLPRTLHIAKRMRIDVDVSLDGQHYQTVPVWFAVSAYATAWIARQRMAADAVVVATQWHKKKVDVAAFGGGTLLSEPDFGGMQLTHAVTAGAPLLREHIMSVPDIRRGDTVTVLLQRGAMRIETSAVALAAGNRGERITLRTKNHQRLFATVQSHGWATQEIEASYVTANP